jgi:arsenate reductase
MPDTVRKKVLFLCIHNSCRSQMAEALLRHMYGVIYESYSAGSEPTMVHPLCATVMEEIGIDISRQQSKPVSRYAGQRFDYAVTTCKGARKMCPVFPGNTKRLYWAIEDPAMVKGREKVKLAAFRKTRNELKRRIIGKFGVKNTTCQKMQLRR